MYSQLKYVMDFMKLALVAFHFFSDLTTGYKTAARTTPIATHPTIVYLLSVLILLSGNVVLVSFSILIDTFLYCK